MANSIDETSFLCPEFHFKTAIPSIFCKNGKSESLLVYVGVSPKAVIFDI